MNDFLSCVIYCCQNRSFPAETAVQPANHKYFENEILPFFSPSEEIKMKGYYIGSFLASSKWYLHLPFVPIELTFIIIPSPLPCS